MSAVPIANTIQVSVSVEAGVDGAVAFGSGKS
jgi:hypothetical protein